MPRIAGVDIPENKKIRYSLRYIHGIGPAQADVILAKAEIEPERRAKDLSDDEVSQIATVMDGEDYIVEGALRRQTSEHVQRLREIRSYRGERHRRGLPVRGQRTRCNARTRKGKKKTVAGKKGVKG